MIFDSPQPVDPQAARLGAEHAWSRSLMMVLGLALLGIGVFAAFQPDLAAFASVLTVALLLATTCLLVGGLVGFLFAIPRSLQQGEEPPPEAAEEPQDEDVAPQQARQRRRAGYQANTNLEQISDWLTKILVGVGLTQLGEIRTGFLALAEYFGPALGGTAASGPFTVVVVATFLTCGFLVGYLWSRLYLASAFSRADRQARTVLTSVSHAVSRMEQRLSHQEDQDKRDADALSLVQRSLEPETGEPDADVEELKSSLRQASPSVKVHAFYRAQKLRTETWTTDKALMARTIPIFEALAESNEDRFHRDYAQLGYALKDQPEPDWQRAFDALTRAIEIRGTWKENGWLMYEFNRAICRIELDADFRAGRPSGEDAREAILEDLHAAARSSFVRDCMEDSVIREWLEINEVTLDDLDGDPTREE